MSPRRLHHEQPEAFAFDEDDLAFAKREIAKFPVGRQASAVLALLTRAQERDGWVSEPAIRYVADLLEMPYIRVLEVATFYTILNLEPVGRHLVNICGTTPCALRGAEELIRTCERVIGPRGQVTQDGLFSWIEVECMGACTNGPMAQIGKDYFEDLTSESLERVLNELRAGREVRPGPQNGRQFSAPEGGPTTLLDPAIFERATHEGGGPVDHPSADAAARPNLDIRANQGASDTPGDRAEAGKPPIRPGDQAEADRAQKAGPKPPHAEEEHRPVMLEGPRGQADDLTRLKGVGAKLEAQLHRLGVYHFDQIASWTPENLRWVDMNLGTFKGRATRDKWIEQATVLANGGTEAQAAEVAPEAGSDV